MNTLIKKGDPEHSLIHQYFLPDQTEDNILIITGPAEHIAYLGRLDDEYNEAYAEEVTAETIYQSLLHSDASLDAIQASLIEDVDNLKLTAEEAIDISFKIVAERFERHMSMLNDNINNLFN